MVRVVDDVVVEGGIRPPDSRRLQTWCRSIGNPHLRGRALAEVVDHDVSLLKGGVFSWQVRVVWVLSALGLDYLVT